MAKECVIAYAQEDTALIETVVAALEAMHYEVERDVGNKGDARPHLTFHVRVRTGREWRGDSPGEFTVFLDMVAADDVVPYVTENVRRIEDDVDYERYERSVWPTLRLEPVRRAFRSDRLTLFCGAGISVDAGIPCWGTLLNALLLQVLERQGAKVALDAAERFHREVGGSPLIIARHLRRLLGADFEAVVRDTLYATKPQHRTRLLEAIHSMCSPVREPRVAGVVTFNFDDLIEQGALDEAWDRVKHTVFYEPIFKEGQIQETHGIPVYHVHGYLPREGAIDPAMHLVFSEEGYHEQFADPFAWSNLTILNHLTQYTCLFVGLSMTDPNLRRLLDVAHRKNGGGDRSHFIIRKRRIPTDAPPPVDDAEELSQTLARTADTVEEGDGESLGVKTIWVDEFRAISVVLRALHLDEDQS